MVVWNSSIDLIVKSGGQLQMMSQKSNEAFWASFLLEYINENYPTKGAK